MNTLTIRKDRLEKLRKLCLALPAATEKIAWGDPTWRVKDKIFCMQKGNYDGGRPSIWLKAPDGAQSSIVSSDPDLFFVPPYVGSRGWIGAFLDGARIPWPHLAALIETSHALIGKGAGGRRGRGR